jgi:hypothetical protein
MVTLAANGASPTVAPDRTFCACARSPRDGGRSKKRPAALTGGGLSCLRGEGYFTLNLRHGVLAAALVAVAAILARMR